MVGMDWGYFNLYSYEWIKSILICKYLFSGRPKYSQLESQDLLKDFCIAFNDTVDKSQITLEQAAM